MRAPGYTASGVELVGYHDLAAKPGFKLALQVVDGRWYLYVTHFWEPRLSVLDVTDPSAMELVTAIEGPQHTATWQVQQADGLLVQGLEVRPPAWADRRRTLATRACDSGTCATRRTRRSRVNGTPGTPTASIAATTPAGRTSTSPQPGRGSRATSTSSSTSATRPIRSRSAAGTCPNRRPAAGPAGASPSTARRTSTASVPTSGTAPPAWSSSTSPTWPRRSSSPSLSSAPRCRA